MTDLNDLLPADSGWELAEARDISEVGQIVGSGMSPNGKTHAFVLIPCPADLNGDGDINAADLALLLGSWGSCPGCASDLSGDDVVNAADLAILLGNWGQCT